MNKNMFIYSFVVLLSYLIVTLFWLIIYIFLGEDTQLNSIEIYQNFTNFTVVYLMIVALHICLIDKKKLNVIITGIGLMIIPLLIAGYCGAIGVDIQCDDLIKSRFVIMTIYSVVYIMCAIKLIRIDRIFRDYKEVA